MKQIDNQEEIKTFAKKCYFRNGKCPIQDVKGMELNSHCEQCYEMGAPIPFLEKDLYNGEDITTSEAINKYKRELAEDCKFAGKNYTCRYKDCFDICSFCDREFSR